MPKRLFLLFTALFIILYMHGQIHFKANVQNMHLWRGIEVADGLVLTSDISISSSQDLFRLGVWGGTNTQGSYKEFNYYAGFNYAGFSLTLCDTYNFSPGASYNNKEFFNYKANETGRFLDAVVDYRFGEKFPLLLKWSIIVFGRDRNSANTANKYSSFCYAEYPLYRKNNWCVEAGIGGAFALHKAGDSTHFYGDSAGIVHTALKISRNVGIGQWEVPVFAYMMWNPQGDRAFFQIGAELFSF